jgi:hypothetical protein
MGLVDGEHLRGFFFSFLVFGGLGFRRRRGRIGGRRDRLEGDADKARREVGVDAGDGAGDGSVSRGVLGWERGRDRERCEEREGKQESSHGSETNAHAKEFTKLCWIWYR